MHRSANQLSIRQRSSRKVCKRASPPSVRTRAVAPCKADTPTRLSADESGPLWAATGGQVFVKLRAGCGFDPYDTANQSRRRKWRVRFLQVDQYRIARPYDGVNSKTV